MGPSPCTAPALAFCIAFISILPFGRGGKLDGAAGVMLEDGFVGVPPPFEGENRAFEEVSKSSKIAMVSVPIMNDWPSY
jgi:hypothetical protein